MASATKKLIAVIAGVGPGTGAAVAKKFAANYPVVLLARKSSSFESLAQEINSSGGSAFGVETDVGDEGSVKNAIEQLKSKFGADVGIAVSTS
jgi:NADP-dependent 3-hydroxy acid dehydrogenase YdfG